MLLVILSAKLQLDYRPESTVISWMGDEYILKLECLITIWHRLLRLWKSNSKSIGNGGETDEDIIVKPFKVYERKKGKRKHLIYLYLYGWLIDLQWITTVVGQINEERYEFLLEVYVPFDIVLSFQVHQFRFSSPKVSYLLGVFCIRFRKLGSLLFNSFLIDS